jgi:biotin synthase
MRLTEITALLGGVDDRGLFAAAEALTRENFGDEVYLRGIIEFSNNCNKNCCYCGLRKDNAALHRYRMTVPEILHCLDLARELALPTVVLQSGDDFTYAKEDIGQIVTDAKAKADVAVTLSLGDRPNADFDYWRELGADRYLLKVETFDEALYARSRPGLKLADRLARIDTLRRAGYEVGSGIITDLPGMTSEILASDLIHLSELDLDMIAAGPFVPNPDTPYGDQAGGSVLTALRVVAILRLLNPLANIPATSALNALRDGAREQGLTCGANVIMPSITPEEISGDYAIYPGKNAFRADAQSRLAAVKQAIRRVGRIPSTAIGGSKRREPHG